VDAPRHLPSFALFETVCCLECSEVYSKPVGGGTVRKNPGCPVCGYVGWIPLSLPEEREEPHRSGGDLQLRLIGRRR
jgi:hypothetical protein